MPKSISPRTMVQVTTRSSRSNPAIQFSTRGSALIRSLIAFVSSRVTPSATCRTRPRRAQAGVRLQSRHPGHRRLHGLDEAALEWFAARLRAMSACPGEIANAQQPAAPRFFSAPQQSPANRVQDRRESRSPSLPLSQCAAAPASRRPSGTVKWMEHGRSKMRKARR